MISNDNTLVAVSGYLGDAHQIGYNMKLYQHHNCPVVVLSPEDAKITKIAAANPRQTPVFYRFGGKRAYIGQDSLDRQQIYHRILLEYPQKYFLFNDSDSFCLCPKIPRYLYDADPDIVWSNEADERVVHPHVPDAFLAMQPPYFFHRQALEKMVATPREKTLAHPNLPFIDRWFMDVNKAAGLQHRNFPDGATFSTHDDFHCSLMENCVRSQRKIFLHSIKRQSVVMQLMRVSRSIYPR